jgi:LysR family transcriptional regulator for metE and metH
MNADLLEVRHLRLVRAIAEEGGPTAAAARLHLTQSAVSHQLAELEGRLGVALFARVRRRLTPTAAGARLVEEAHRLLADLARVERELHRTGEKKRVLLRIAVETFTGYHWLPRVAAALAQHAPHVDVRVVVDATREPVVALTRGALDVALVASPVHDRQLHVVPLFDDEWAVVMAPGHDLARRPWISARELGGQTLFTHDAPRSDVERLRDLVSAERAPMPRVSTVPLTDLLVAYVRAGGGVGMMSRWAAAPHVARGEIVSKRFTRNGLPEHWVAVTRHDTKAGAHVAKFIELTRTLAAPDVANEKRARR